MNKFVPKDQWLDGGKKQWSQPQDVLDWTLTLADGAQKILDVGPGEWKFPLATHTCGWQYGPQVLDTNKIVDFTTQQLPYEDNEFDFVYCRHTLEDLTYPFLLLYELGRVGKRGYIETPSILCELAREADASSPPWRGFHHHVWFTWVEDDIMHFCHKFPLVEHCNFREVEIRKILKSHPHLWFNYYVWDKAPGFRHHVHDRDFCLAAGKQPLIKYEYFLAQQCEKSADRKHQFYQTHIAKNT